MHSLFLRQSSEPSRNWGATFPSLTDGDTFLSSRWLTN
jgi:hypothetical protein